jgi:hypothetical protein
LYSKIWSAILWTPTFTPLSEQAQPLPKSWGFLLYERKTLKASGGRREKKDFEERQYCSEANNGVYIVSKGMVLVCVIIVFLHCETVRCGKSSSISATKIKELSKK